jgi:hypothetical protein
MNYIQHGNQEVDASWGIASSGLKRNYQRTYGRQPSYKEMENFRYFLCDPKPTNKEMQRYYYKGGF